MKTYQLWIALFFVTGVAGCRTVAESNSTPGDFDPVLQVSTASWQYEHGQKFDVGVAFFRDQLSDGTQPNNDPTTARMAFASNGNPVQVKSAIVNGVSLVWYPDEASSMSNMYDIDNSNAYGEADSMTFTYNGFAGESFTSTVDIAPSFGNISGPDTISASKGCTFKYDNFVPGDTITVSGYGVSFTMPDTGTITFLPNQLTYDSYVAQNGYEIYWSCSHWTTRMSPSGKRIGIYSSQETSLNYPAKP